VSQTATLLQLQGSQAIQFNGITFEHTDWPIPDRGYPGIQACMFDDRSPQATGWSPIPAAVELEETREAVFRNCTFRHLGGSGVSIGKNSHDNQLVNCTIEDVAGNGINIGEGQDRQVEGQPWWKAVPQQVSSDNRITHCRVNDCGTVFYGAVGIWCGLVARTTIDSNEISKLPYSGISIGWMWDTVPTPCLENAVLDNHIHHIMGILSDGGGVYSLGRQPGSRISGNLIHDVSINAGRAESNGMFLDEGTKELVISDNIIYHIAMSPLRFHRAASARIENNVLSCNDGLPPIRYNRTPEDNITKINNVILQDTLAQDLHLLEERVQQWQSLWNGR